MLLRSQELYEPVPERDYRESLDESPLPHGALSSRFSAVLRACRFYNSGCTGSCDLLRLETVRKGGSSNLPSVGLTVIGDQKRAERFRCDVSLGLVSSISGVFRTVSLRH